MYCVVRISVKISDQSKIKTKTKKLPVNARISTQSETRGTIRVTSSSNSLPQINGGRQTRNSKKAIRPLSPNLISAEKIQERAELTEKSPTSKIEGSNLSEVTTPTHPIQFEPDLSFPVFPYPTISQLRDYPNVSEPAIQTQQSVIVTLPSSAPTSPTLPIPFKSVSNTSSPCSSPGGVSVILSNPGFRPLPPISQPAVSTPIGACSWDNYLEIPTYQREFRRFWETREPHRVQIVSTDISDLEDSLSPKYSNDSVGLLDQGTLYLSSSPLGAKAPSDLDMPAQSRKVEMDLKINILRSQQTGVEDMCDDLSPDLITTNSASAMERELEKIEVARNSYRNEVRKFLQDFDTELTDVDKDQWNSTMKLTVDKVNKHKMTILDKVSQLAPKVTPMSEFEKATIEIQKQQLELQQKAADTRKEESLAVSKPLSKLILEKCNQLEEELEQVSVSQLKGGDDQLITRVIHKLAGGKEQLNSVMTLH